jgi:hypothetical protein
MPIDPDPIDARPIEFHNGQPDTRPTLSRADLEKQYPGYFPGSVNGEIDRWKRRALAAEEELRILREEHAQCAKR